MSNPAVEATFVVPSVVGAWLSPQSRRKAPLALAVDPLDDVSAVGTAAVGAAIAVGAI